MSGKKKITPQQHNNLRKNQIAEKLRNKHSATLPPKTICLNMIVRNESANMKILLDSLKTTIDFISIVDTGSVDDTKQIIENWGKENNIPTTVHEEPFKNFAYNRTHSIEMAKKTYPNADYFLLSDADFTWEIDVGGKFDKRLLVDHKYLVEQYNNVLRYWNIRLLSSKVDWECVGVTHEYWSEKKNQSEFNGYVRIAKLHTIVINDRETGGHKANKYQRDYDLLTNGLSDPKEPDHLKTRYKFYLAQTLKDLGRYEESNEMYNKRAQDKGWAEEVFYSKFQIGANYERMAWEYKNTIRALTVSNPSNHEKALILKYAKDNISLETLLEKSKECFLQASINYMAATEYRKSRNEALYYCARMFRSLGMNEQCYELCLRGKTYSYPHDDTLFIEKATYDYLWDYEMSVVCFYLPEHKEEGREALARLLARKDLPTWLTNICENNATKYL
jgi:glycosyltransferase involved in cell wall biosynthesis